MFLGIDGGASKTAGVLADAGGRVVCREVAGRSAFSGRPSDEACAVLKGLADALCGQAGVPMSGVESLGLGLSGVDFPEDLPMQRQVLAAALGVAEERVHLVNDGIVALWGATDSPEAALLQHGSGFTSAFRSRFGDEQLFDHLNVGRQFDLRAEAVKQVARMLDGRVEATGLKDAVLARLGVTAEEFPEAVYKNRVPLGSRSPLAPVVFACWQAGDAAAEAIVREAAADYVLAAGAMVRRAGGGPAVAVFGGGVIMQAPPEFWDLLSDLMRDACPEATVRQPELPPDAGAAVMAAFCAGREPKAFFRRVRDSRP